MISKFDALWIPDFEKEPSLSGILSHNFGKIDLPVTYLGLVSRLTESDERAGENVLIVLSGPEPQRSKFEKIVREQVLLSKRTVVLIRGVVEGSREQQQIGNFTIYDFANTGTLEKLYNDAFVIVSRSGYTTLMDLAKTKKKALLVPTPGQTEQIYLAEQLDAKGVFAFQEQSKFNLEEGVERAMKKEIINIYVDSNLNNAIKELGIELDLATINKTETNDKRKYFSN